MRRRGYLSLATVTLAGLSGCMGDTEYTITDIRIPDTSEPIALEIALVDAAAAIEGPASLDITLRNDGNQAVEIRNTGVWPLGLLGLTPSGRGGPGEILLQSDQYANTDRVRVAEGEVSSEGGPLIQPLDAGESVTEQYEVHGNQLYDTGTYTLRGYFDETLLSYRIDDSEDWTEFSPDVSITVEEMSLFP